MGLFDLVMPPTQRREVALTRAATTVVGNGVIQVAAPRRPPAPRKGQNGNFEWRERTAILIGPAGPSADLEETPDQAGDRALGGQVSGSSTIMLHTKTPL
jgi:hypothetical protein